MKEFTVDGIKIVNGGVTAATGFKAAGMSVGIKNNGKKDMAMIFSEKPCVTAGTFTLNKVFAAPVKWDKNIVYNEETAQVVIVNNGIANACTGVEGDNACALEAKTAAEALGISEKAVLLGSTGVIGMQLPMEKICTGIKELPAKLDSSIEAGKIAAESIMTTDTRAKEVAVEVEIGGKKVTIGGMCKGAGMIHPHMATMLCYVTTDAVVEKKTLQKMMSGIIDDTFNMISVDGDTSTNDTALVLANGLAGNPEINGESPDYDLFERALYYVFRELSKKIAGDGEGCTCLFEVQVKGAATKEQAKILAKSIATSNLTKCAIFGHDANWGRILCAMGYSGADLEPEKVEIFFESDGESLQIVKDGTATDYSEEKATEILSKNSVVCVADVHMGSESATAWGCDLTFDYIKINADYRS